MDAGGLGHHFLEFRVAVKAVVGGEDLTHHGVLAFGFARDVSLHCFADRLRALGQELSAAGTTGAGRQPGDLANLLGTHVCHGFFVVCGEIHAYDFTGDTTMGRNREDSVPLT